MFKYMFTSDLQEDIYTNTYVSKAHYMILSAARPPDM